MSRIHAPGSPSGVHLSRDEHGVPHVHADDLHGILWGMGFAHALDRGTQMCLMRILGRGEAAEHLSGDEATVAIDRFFRRMNWSAEGDQVDALSPETRSLLDAYCAGVNARLLRRPPLVMRLMGYKPDPWSPRDCLTLTRMTGYLTLAQSQGEVERFFVELVQAGVDDARLEALFPGCFDAVSRELLARVELHERVVPEAVTWAGVLPRLMASNNWVVAASHSVSGHALMANDPHLEVNRLPNVWVEQVLELPDDTVLTANMPGLPGALVGRKRSLAWGATYAFMDAIDSWVEDCRDGTYRRGDTWQPFRERREVIRRKGGDPIEVVFYENDHGVLDGDPNVAGHYLCTRWSVSDAGAASLEAIAAMWGAGTVAEGMAAIGGVEAAFNWVFADSTGSIGYQMSGLFPLRHPDANGFAPMPGWDPAYDWQGFATPEQLPRLVDPDEGFIVTANQDLNHLGALRVQTMPMADHRARRIAQVLAEGPQSVDSCRKLQLDVHSLQADELLEVLLPLIRDDERAEARILRDWDRGYGVDQVGPVVFEAFYDALRREVFGHALGNDVVEHLLAETGIFTDFYQDFDRILLADASPWFGERTRSDVYRAAFDQVRVDPNARWGDDNRVVLRNILLGGKLPGWLGFDVGPVEIPGGRATPHQGQVYTNAGRDTSFVPSLRILADLGEDTLHTAMAGGPTDRRSSRWYTSELRRWQAGETKELRRNGPAEPGS